MYGITRGGQQVQGFALRNQNGLEVRCIAYGCRLTHILAPDGSGGKANLILGYDTLEKYEDDSSFQGAVVGRYANRIAGAEMELAGKVYHLTQNDGENYLHGSWHRQVFKSEPAGENSVVFSYTAPDGEDGFPGEVAVRVSYTLTEENSLIIDYKALPQAATYVNMTNHAYFNLAGKGDVLSHTLRLNSRAFLETGPGLIPTGRVLEAAGAFDFSAEKPIGRDIAADNPQLRAAGGYDHCFIVNEEHPAPAFAAELKHPASGRAMRVHTSQPGIQLYTGNMLAGFEKHAALCLETQHFPDSPHWPQFPAALVEARREYHHIAIFNFSW